MAAARASEAAELRRGVALEVLTIAWVAVEAGAGLYAAARAGSVALLAFGADSLIELISATVLLLRLRAEATGGSVERTERRAGIVVGVLLLALALWVVAGSLRSLLVRAAPESSLLGLLITAAAVVIMPLMVRAKRRVAARIGSPALRADAACGVTCAYLAGVALLGVGLRASLGWWWADPLAGLGIVYFLVAEGREALRGEPCADCARE